MSRELLPRNVSEQPMQKRIPIGSNFVVGAEPLPESPTLKVGSSPFFTTWSDVLDKANRLDTGIQDFAKDVENKIVYQDPTALRATADAVAIATPDVAVNLRERADILEKRAATLSPAQLAKEREFAAAFGPWLESWIILTDRIKQCQGVATGCFWFDAPWTAWNQVESYETDYFKWVAAFKELGYGVTNPLATPTEVDKDHPSTSPVKDALDSTTSLIKTVGFFAVIIGGGYMLYKWQAGKSGGGESSPASVNVNVSDHPQTA